MGSRRTTSGGWTRLQCSCTVTSAPVLLGTSSAGGGQGSPPHKHPAHTQTPSPCAFSSLCALCSDGVCLLCFITRSSIFQRRSHTFVSGWDLIRKEPLCRSLFFTQQRSLIRVFFAVSLPQSRVLLYPLCGAEFVFLRALNQKFWHVECKTPANAHMERETARQIHSLCDFFFLEQVNVTPERFLDMCPLDVRAITSNNNNLGHNLILANILSRIRWNI